MKIRVLRKVFRKQFCFIRCRRKHLRIVELRRYSRFNFVEKTISDLPKVTRAKFVGSNELFCFISICKFGSFNNPYASITSLSQLYFRSRRFTLLVQMEKVISVNYGSSTRSWKPWRWVRLDLIFSMGDIYIKSNWTHSQNSLTAAEAPSLRISSNAGFYQSPFLYSHFFSKDWVSLMFSESVGHQWEKFWNLNLQITGKCISDILFDFKAHIVHRW